MFYHFINEVCLVETVNRHTAEEAENKAKGRLEQFLFTQKPEPFHVQCFPERQANHQVHAACVWRHNHHGLFQ